MPNLAKMIVKALTISPKIKMARKNKAMTVLFFAVK
jgi:hypothetical protein